MSPDMFTHSVSYFAEAPLSHHNASRVKLFVYSCVGKPDAKTARLQAKVLAVGGVWRDVARLPEPQLAQQIRQDEIDVLVELTGVSGCLTVVGVLLKWVAVWLCFMCPAASHLLPCLLASVCVLFLSLFSLPRHALFMFVPHTHRVTPMFMPPPPRSHYLPCPLSPQATPPTTGWVCVPCVRHRCRSPG